MHDSKVELLYDIKDKLENLRSLSTIRYITKNRIVKTANIIAGDIECVIHDLAEEQIDAGGEDPGEQVELV